VNQKGFGVIYILVGVLILAVVTGGAYYLGKSTAPKPSIPVVSQTPQPTASSQVTPSPTPYSITSWKTYTSSSYSLKYPANLYIHEYNDDYQDLVIGDIPNPQMRGSLTPKVYLTVGFYNQSMPKSFPYTNGSDKNDTIMPYPTNGYTGIRGKQTSPLGLGEAVYLQNPNGGYAVLSLQIGDINIFNQILSTFKFTQ